MKQGKKKKGMKVLMAGIFDLEDYMRGRVLYQGLKQNKVEVELLLNQKQGKYRRLFRRFKQGNFDVLLVNGKIVMLIAKLAMWWHKKPIIFDVFISDYDTLVQDRKIIREKSLKAKLLWLLDKYSCLFADAIILDTNAHVDFFVQEFNLSEEKFEVIPVGCDESIFKPRKKPETGKFLVSFYGSFIPLQGVQFIIKAAKLLQPMHVYFELIGEGQTYDTMKELAKDLGCQNVQFLGKKPLQELPKHMAKADVCLGIFGKTDKAKRVIPTKAYAALAMRKPLVTGDTPAARELLKDSDTCIFCKMADGESLANTIGLVKTDKIIREKIAENGYQLFVKKCSSKVIGKMLKDYLEKVVEHHR
ncbi:glycosyltransferase family 4 protein [Candidatus Woesearchaeota archaeon]|nr:glycosyltransferase family 4 protein [Candidatus Woesearchaeota archaeon]